MANPRRVRALLAMADENLSGAKALLAISTRLARYHVQQGAEKAVKALLEQRAQRDIGGGPAYRFANLGRPMR